MNESADESDLLCFKRPVKLAEVSVEAQERVVDSPNITLQQFKTQIILSLGALYDLIFNSSGTA